MKVEVDALICQSLIARQQMDNATIDEAVFQDVVLHDVIILVRVDADIAFMRETEVHNHLEYAVGIRTAGDTVDDMIG